MKSWGGGETKTTRDLTIDVFAPHATKDFSSFLTMMSLKKPLKKILSTFLISVFVYLTAHFCIGLIHDFTAPHPYCLSNVNNKADSHESNVTR